MRNQTEILADYRATLAAVSKEAAQRKAVEETEEYQAFEKQIADIKEQQNKLFAGISDSREEHAMDKQELINYMEESKEFRVGEFRAKTRVEREVNTRMVLEAMQGDIDSLMLVTKIPIKNIEDFAKANPEYKRDLKKCIEEKGYKVTDVVLDAA